jgi:hypothetical protein
MEGGDREYARDEEKIGGSEVRMTQMQKTFLKSSIGVRGRKKGGNGPVTKKSPVEGGSAPRTVEVLSAQEYSDMLDDVERPST